MADSKFPSQLSMIVLKDFISVNSVIVLVPTQKERDSSYKKKTHLLSRHLNHFRLASIKSIYYSSWLDVLFHVKDVQIHLKHVL